MYIGFVGMCVQDSAYVRLAGMYIGYMCVEGYTLFAGVQRAMLVVPGGDEIDASEVLAQTIEAWRQR